MSVIVNGSTGITTPASNISGTATVAILNSPPATALTIQSAGTTAMTIDTSQNVGIGATSLTTKFTVQTSALGDAIRWTDNINSTGILATASGLSTMWSTAALGFGTGGVSYTERMRIDSSGNVGIGTNSPSIYGGKLVVSGGDVVANSQKFYSRISSSDANSVRGFYQTIDGYEYLHIYHNNTIAAFDVNGLTRMAIDGSGYLLVGYTSSNGAYKLQVNSQIFATSSTIATSDARYKQNVQTLNGALNIVKALRPVSFDWKKHPVHAFDTENTTVGFLAQEVQQVLADKPYLNSIIKKNECVIEPEVKDENGAVTTAAVTEEFLGIAEGNMIAILTSAIQELSAKNDALEAVNAAFEARLAALEVK